VRRHVLELTRTADRGDVIRNAGIHTASCGADGTHESAIRFFLIDTLHLNLVARTSCRNVDSATPTPVSSFDGFCCQRRTHAALEFAISATRAGVLGPE